MHIYVYLSLNNLNKIKTQGFAIFNEHRTLNRETITKSVNNNFQFKAHKFTEQAYVSELTISMKFRIQAKNCIGLRRRTIATKFFRNVERETNEFLWGFPSFYNLSPLCIISHQISKLATKGKKRLTIESISAHFVQFLGQYFCYIHHIFFKKKGIIMMIDQFKFFYK